MSITTNVVGLDTLHSGFEKFSIPHYQTDIAGKSILTAKYLSSFSACTCCDLISVYRELVDIRG